MPESKSQASTLAAARSGALELAAAVLIAALVFWPWRVGPLSDDFVLLHAIAQRGAWTAGVYDALGVKFFRPLATLSLALGGAGAAAALAQHAANVLLHALNAWLVGRAAAALLVPGRLGTRETWLTLPRAAMLMFLVLPCRAEPVVWISGRPDLLATLGCLVALNAWLAWRARPSGAADKAWLLGVALAAYALALLAKESAVTFGAVIWAVEWLGPRRTQQSAGDRVEVIARPWRALAAFALLPLGYLALRAGVLGEWIGGYGAGRHLGAGAAALAVNGVKAVVRTLLPPLALAAGAAVLAAAALAGLAWLTAYELRRLPGIWKPEARRRGALLMAGLVVTLTPALPLPVSLRVTEGERLIYLPSVFVALALAWAAMPENAATAGAGASRRRRLGCLGLLAAAFIWANVRSAATWRVAGALAGSALDGAHELPADAVLLNVPDNWRGAYVFRNGFNEARALGAWGRPPRPPLLLGARQAVWSLDDQTIAETGETSMGLRVRLTARDARARFLPDPTNPLIAEVSPSGIEAELNLPAGRTAWVFSAGRWLAINSK